MRVRSTAFAIGCLVLGLLAGCRDEGELSIPPFPETATAAGSIDITVGSMGLWMASAFIPDSDPNAQQVRHMLSGLKSVRVRVYKLTPGTPPPEEALASLRRQLTGPGWSRLVQTRDKRQGEDVDIYVAQDGQAIRGLAVLVTKTEEITVVNVVGTIDSRDLGRLREMALHARKGGDSSGWVTEQ